MSARFLSFSVQKQNDCDRGLPAESQEIDGMEIPSFRFMSAKEHSGIPSRGAPEERKSQKHLFGNSPNVPFRPALIRGIDDERD